ncbi:toxin-antitoxin system YwqK family antitoxin [Flavobacterium sp. J27]|uniref:toxin-antitoxin system YwqK family antitoxin n=1 Tax=Flavobacterium sp. J27 TaxID=2060419 RepID=UPI001030C312|nr:hypothetical protein [Flavobacterium sp. J27]
MKTNLFFIILLIKTLNFYSQTDNPCGFKDDLQIGTCKDFYETGQLRSVANWKDGKLDGDYTFYHPNGKIQSKGFYTKNVQSGKWFFYTEDGFPISEESYLYDKGLRIKNGLFRFYNKQGILVEETSYTKDAINGLGKLYFDNGFLKQETNYKNGETVGLTKIYKEKARDVLDGIGKMAKNGVITGEWKYFHDDGKTIDLIGSYNEKGEQIGKWQSFYNTGILKAESFYNNGKRDGERKLYKEDGSLEKTEIYKNGTLVK